MTVTRTIGVVVEPPTISIVGTAQLGPQGPEGPPGGTRVASWWDYHPSTSPPPTVGQVRTAPDPLVVGNPMTIYLSATDDTGLSWESGVVNPGDEIILRGSMGAVQRCDVTSFEITAPGQTGYATIEGIAGSVQGQINKNAKVQVSIVRGPITLGPFYEGHTFAVLGDLSAVTTLPAFFVPKHPNQSVRLAGIFADLERGTIKLQIKRNGGDVGPLLTLGQTAVWTPLGDIVMNHGDKISTVLANPVNAPSTLSATVALEWSVP